MKKSLRYLVLSSLFLLVIGILQGCGENDIKKSDKAESKDEVKSDFKS